MEQVTSVWAGEVLSDAAFGALAADLLRQADMTLLPGLFVPAARHPAFWDGDDGAAVLIGVVALLLDTLETGDAEAALMGVAACPPVLAGRMLAMLRAARLPDGVALDTVDDATLLGAAVLLGASGNRADVAPFLAQAGAGRVAAFWAPPAAAIAAAYPPVEDAPFTLKLIVWDLDDTLWTGTLADGDVPVLDAGRIAAVRAFNARGVVSAICSKNEHDAARAVLERHGLWDDFVFPRIAFVPKGAAVKRLIEDMQLRPANVLFVDDNPHNLREVEAAAPGIRTVDARSPDCDTLLAGLLAATTGKSRVADYRLLESRVAAREDSAMSDGGFLRDSGICATFTDRMDNLQFAGRIAELINRSNQLNYTQSRTTEAEVAARIQDIDYYEVLGVFVWDRYGYYGLVGVAVYAFRTRRLEHFAFSCRIMHMGVEDATIRMLAERGYRLSASPDFRKPLPPQSADAITTLPFSDAAVRARVLAAEAPRDEAAVDMRIMADCQSGAFHHYSRFGEVIDFDNNPRLFSLPQMKTGAWREQRWPRHLVYTAATDYIDWRWAAFAPKIDVALFRECADLFVDMVVREDKRCLLFLPPQGLDVAMYELHAGCVPPRSRALHPVLNDHWRAVAARRPGNFALVELGDMLSADELIHAHHYTPAALRRISGVIDAWYEGARDEQRLAA
ncbi:HAD-IIIC family phosphatase [Sphingomonas sp.]|uniref:HAD-IIIC family phosphatase n=1 Tax=Sphingomonas sp. TaxID=28214 RepID=UPI003AFFA518